VPGRKAEQAQDFDAAVVEYTKVLKEHPDDREARLSLDRAKLRAALDHHNRGSGCATAGASDEALVELQIASELNPANGDTERRSPTCASQLRNKVAVTREGKTQLETLIERSRDLPPLGIDLPADARVPAAIAFGPNASARDVFTALGRFANVNVVFDPTYRDQTVTIDLRNSTFERRCRPWRPARATSTASPGSAPSPWCPTRRPSGANTKRKSFARSSSATQT
jgi:hypothetical protein